jgi:ATP-dependent DNA helicase RecG
VPKLSDSVQYLKGVGPKRAALLEGVGIATIGDALQLFPRKYIDRGDVVPLSKVTAGREVAVRGRIIDMRSPRWGDRLEAMIADETGELRVIWFHARFLAKALQTGAEYLLYGRVVEYKRTLQLQHPKFERMPDGATDVPGSRLLVEYPTHEGLQQASLVRMAAEALRVGLPLVKETLPAEMRRRLVLVDLADALRMIHQPESLKEVREARRRLIFSEFFLMEMAVWLRRRSAMSSHNAPPIPVSAKVDEHIRARFPYAFTAAQDKSVAEIRADLARDRPMTRLLQGDVGSGKTAVALYAALSAVAAGYQAALMAPTEILAAQHYHNVEKYLVGSRVKWALLVGGMTASERQRTVRRIRHGDADIIVGTHALIQQDVTFSRLGLVIVDEQHKFGVLQRAEAKWQPAADDPRLQPHYLVMTATPIPRTLALTVFGDLDVSTIDQMPPGRTPIETWTVGPRQRTKAHTFIRRELKAGRQAFVVYPLVEENEKSDLLAATDEAERLQRDVFPEFRVGLLHGRMKADEKDRVMEEFRAGRIQLLVSTVVIEVGVDVPNATVMMVEHAERFGLAQLHQLRGRIGRGAAKSTCILLANPETDEAKRRIQVMCETSDGFRIAEEDLRLRGPGEFFGTRQHGVPELMIGNIVEDYDLLRLARTEALEWLKGDPHLANSESVQVRRALVKRFADTMKLIEVG